MIRYTFNALSMSGIGALDVGRWGFYFAFASAPVLISFADSSSSLQQQKKKVWPGLEF